MAWKIEHVVVVRREYESSSREMQFEMPLYLCLP